MTTAMEKIQLRRNIKGQRFVNSSEFKVGENEQQIIC